MFLKLASLFSLIVLGFSFCAFCQSYNIRKYDASNGLPASLTRVSYEDRKGFLWIGTIGGLSRFDGKNFITYTIHNGLPGNIVSCIAEDQEGNLLVGTRQGMAKFDGRHFTLLPASLKLTVYYFTQSFTSHDSLFVLSGGTCFQVRKDSLVQVDLSIWGMPKKIRLNHIGINSTGDWLLDCGDSLYARDHRGIISRVLLPGEPAHLNGITVRNDSFVISSNKGIWLTKNGGITHIAVPELANKNIIAVYTDKDRTTWISVEDHGILVMDPSNAIKYYAPFENESVKFFSDIFQDRSGNIWISGYNALNKLTPSFTETFTKGNGLSTDDIRLSVNTNDGQAFFAQNESYFLWADSNDRLAYPSANVRQQLEASQKGSRILGLQKDDQKRIWFSTYDGGLYRYSNNHLEDLTGKYSKGRPAESNMLFDTLTKAITFFYEHEMITVKNDQATVISKVNNGSSLGNVICAVKSASGKTWLAEHFRVLVFDGKKIKDVSSQLNFLPVQINQLYCFQQHLFIATSGKGVFEYSFTSNDTLKLESTFTTDNTLSNDNVLAVLVDRQNYMWALTLEGVNRVNLGSKREDGSYYTKHMDASDGVGVTNWANASMTMDGYGDVWAGTMNGIIHFKTALIKINSNAPYAAIESVTFLNTKKGLAGNDSLYILSQHRETPSLAYYNNSLIFHFTGINLRNGSIRYSYMLEGLDKIWHTRQTGTDISYYNLEPGDYTFMVKAGNEDGVESAVTSFPFIVRPPFWKTWWFRILAGLIAAGVIYYFIKRRDKLIARQNAQDLQLSELRLQALQSQMNPHFIFNSLNSIQNYIMQHEPLKAASYLADFSKLMRRILDSSSEYFMPLEEVMETLKMYVKLEAFRFNNEFTYAFDIETDTYDKEILLPPMLFQPYVENAILHGLMPKEGEKKLRIHIFIESGILHCHIDDNGVGRNAAGNKKNHVSRGEKLTHGMLDSLQHMQNIEAGVKFVDKLDAQSKPAGTRVELTIPLTA